MRLRQHERLAVRLRQAKARGDVLGVTRLQQALAKRAEEAAAARRPERISLRTIGAPTAREAHRVKRATVVAAGTVDAVAVFRVTPGVWADWAADS